MYDWRARRLNQAGRWLFGGSGRTTDSDRRLNRRRLKADYGVNGERRGGCRGWRLLAGVTSDDGESSDFDIANVTIDVCYFGGSSGGRVSLCDTGSTRRTSILGVTAYYIPELASRLFFHSWI
jgi:hypothetical protein